ncbi:hypothetical protein BOO69_02505 [Sulfitobacter alexandrii]|uniref:DUF2946 domain-containing protein n=1 Tax=Sulfitobacter alexandrii TaxID=1917485 RepID=A0A1J0WDN5_9RHOB|nr:hypothetical protein [Sulfitobacter alexandrii]APE42411.1 hypothetical protein BOO69_02505 [Sulfitobacter alexandrii]
MTRTLSSLLLALLLALTSQSMAVARGSAAATGQMVLCTGTGPLAVYVDAQGQPTQAPHICPDSALNVVFDGAAPAVVLPRRLVFFQPGGLQAGEPARASHRPTPPPRAPPVPV